MRLLARGALALVLVGMLSSSCGPDDRKFGDASGGAGAVDTVGGQPPSDQGGSDAGRVTDDPGAGAGGLGTVEELVITTQSLPAAGLNVPYEAQLVASGGSGKGYQFVATGDLPPGLALTTEGILSGTPGATGTFTLAVTVTDSVANEASQELSLQVTRKRWLAYTSDEVTARQDILYVVDLESPLLPRTQLSVGLAAGEQVESFAFSPDGLHLAFVVNRGEANGYARNLYISNLSGDDAKAGVLVPTDGDVYWPDARAWALDSSELLFGVEVGNAHQLFAVGEPDWTEAVRVGDGWQAAWISPTLALIESDQGTGYARRSSQGFGTPQILSFGSDLRVSSAVPERAGFFNEVAQCTGQAHFVDFEAGEIAAFETYTSYAFSPTLDLIAIGRSSPTRVDVHALADYDENAPIVTLDLYDACSISWSNDGSWLTYIGTDGAPHAKRLSPGQPVSYDIAGLPADSNGMSTISADNRWIAAVTSGLFVSAVASTGPQPFVPASEPLPNPQTDFIHEYQFAPNSQSLFYYGEQKTSDVVSIHAVDLTEPEPGPAKELYVPALGAVYAAAWSADSTTVGYTVAEGPSYPFDVPVNLYVSNALEAASKPRKVNRTLYCETVADSTYCQGVSAFQFQP